MRALRQKAKSQNGASITFALLLFLVCAIISSVVIVAATAAAGRMSQRAATDQRYYAVSSAVGLLRDDFNGKTATVEYTEKASAETTTTSPETTKLLDTTTTPATVLDPADYPILADATELLVGKIVAPEAASNTPDREFTLTTELSAEGSPLKNVALDCSIKEYVKPDGRLIFEVSNSVDQDAKKKTVYTLQITFNANISRSASERQTTEGGVTTTTTDIVTTVAWKLASIKKGAVLP